MITITSTPALVCLQGLPILFKVESNMANGEPFFRIKAIPVTGQYELLQPDTLDAVIFDLREYFKPELSVSFTTTASIHANACKQFTVKFYEYYGNPPVDEDSDEADIYVLLGTIPKWQQRDFLATYSGSFTNWLSANIFLSWYPAIPKRVLPDQPEVLYFISPSSAAPYSPTVVVTFTDGTTASHSPAISVNPQVYEVASLPVGYTALGLAAVNPAKTVASYVVTIGGKSRSYVVDHNAYRDKRYIIFRNSLGGYDLLPCTGEVDSSTETTRNTATAVYNPEAATQRLNRMAYNIEATEVERVNTGWLQPGEKRWLNELMISEEVWEMLGGVLSPVLIRNSELDRTERIYEPGSVEIEYERLTYAQ